MATEGNADQALKEFGGAEFTPLNKEAGKKWDTEGNAQEAISEYGGVAYPGDTNSVLRHGPADMPGVKDDSPKSDGGFPI